jgi:hypothetical protein
VLLLLVIVGGGYLGWRYTQSQYYVGADSGQVAIFRGINQNVAGLSLSSIYQRTGIPVNHLPIMDQQSIKSTIPGTGNLGDAQRTVGNIRRDYQTCQAASAAMAAYQDKLSKYNSALTAYQKLHKTTGKVIVKGKVVATPPVAPRRPAAQPQCPPQPVAAAGGTS